MKKIYCLRFPDVLNSKRFVFDVAGGEGVASHESKMDAKLKEKADALGDANKPLDLDKELNNADKILSDYVNSETAEFHRQQEEAKAKDPSLATDLPDEMNLKRSLFSAKNKVLAQFEKKVNEAIATREKTAETFANASSQEILSRIEGRKNSPELGKLEEGVAKVDFDYSPEFTFKNEKNISEKSDWRVYGYEMEKTTSQILKTVYLEKGTSAANELLAKLLTSSKNVKLNPKTLGDLLTVNGVNPIETANDLGDEKGGLMKRELADQPEIVGDLWGRSYLAAEGFKPTPVGEQARKAYMAYVRDQVKSISADKSPSERKKFITDILSPKAWALNSKNAAALKTEDAEQEKKDYETETANRIHDLTTKVPEGKTREALRELLTGALDSVQDSTKRNALFDKVLQTLGKNAESIQFLTTADIEKIIKDPNHKIDSHEKTGENISNPNARSLIDTYLSGLKFGVNEKDFGKDNLGDKNKALHEAYLSYFKEISASDSPLMKGLAVKAKQIDELLQSKDTDRIKINDEVAEKTAQIMKDLRAGIEKPDDFSKKFIEKETIESKNKRYVETIIAKIPESKPDRAIIEGILLAAIKDKEDPKEWDKAVGSVMKTLEAGDDKFNMNYKEDSYLKITKNRDDFSPLQWKTGDATKGYISGLRVRAEELGKKSGDNNISARYEAYIKDVTKTGGEYDQDLAILIKQKEGVLKNNKEQILTPEIIAKLQNIDGQILHLTADLTLKTPEQFLQMEEGKPSDLKSLKTFIEKNRGLDGNDAKVALDKMFKDIESKIPEDQKSTAQEKLASFISHVETMGTQGSDKLSSKQDGYLKVLAQAEGYLRHLADPSFSENLPAKQVKEHLINRDIRLYEKTLADSMDYFNKLATTLAIDPEKKLALKALVDAAPADLKSAPDAEARGLILANYVSALYNLTKGLSKYDPGSYAQSERPVSESKTSKIPAGPSVNQRPSGKSNNRSSGGIVSAPKPREQTSQDEQASWNSKVDQNEKPVDDFRTNVFNRIQSIANAKGAKKLPAQLAQEIETALNNKVKIPSSVEASAADDKLNGIAVSNYVDATGKQHSLYAYVKKDAKGIKKFTVETDVKLS